MCIEIFDGVGRPGLDVYFSPPSGTEVKSECSRTIIFAIVCIVNAEDGVNYVECLCEVMPRSLANVNRRFGGADAVIIEPCVVLSEILQPKVNIFMMWRGVSFVGQFDGL